MLQQQEELASSRLVLYLEGVPKREEEENTASLGGEALCFLFLGYFGGEEHKSNQHLFVLICFVLNHRTSCFVLRTVE